MAKSLASEEIAQKEPAIRSEAELQNELLSLLEDLVQSLVSLSEENKATARDALQRIAEAERATREATRAVERIEAAVRSLHHCPGQRLDAGAQRR